MRSISIGVLACLAIASANGIASAGDDLAASVVKIHVTRQPADPSAPWASLPSHDTRGSGVVVEGDRILTCAHLLSYAKEVLVESEQLPRRVRARVEHLAMGIDLAVLRIDEPGFFDLHPPVSFADEPPSAGDSVTVLGFPEGGSSLSVTEGVISRVEFATFFCRTSGFRIQIDAAVNQGNSGGPAFVDQHLVGIVSTRMREAENIGYLAATEEIELFLDDIGDGRFDGKPRFPIGFTTSENPALREWLELPLTASGVVVDEIHPWDTAYPLHEFDVITTIGGAVIDDQGQVRLDDGTTVSFRGMVQRLAEDDAVSLTVWRDGESLDLVVPLDREWRDLLPHEDGMSRPSYIVYGPLVLTPMTAHLAARLTGPRSPLGSFLAVSGNPILLRQHDTRRFPGEQLVCLACPPLSHPSSRGMYPVPWLVVESVNDAPVRNFEHVVELLRNLDDEFAIFRFAGERFGSVVVRATDVEDVTEEILRDHGIRDRMSPDAREIWDRFAGE